MLQSMTLNDQNAHAISSKQNVNSVWAQRWAHVGSTYQLVETVDIRHRYKISEIGYVLI